MRSLIVRCLFLFLFIFQDGVRQNVLFLCFYVISLILVNGFVFPPNFQKHEFFDLFANRSDSRKTKNCSVGYTTNLTHPHVSYTIKFVSEQIKTFDSPCTISASMSFCVKNAFPSHPIQKITIFKYEDHISVYHTPRKISNHHIQNTL